MTTKELQAMSAEELLEIAISTTLTASRKFTTISCAIDHQKSARAEIVRLINLAREALGGDSGASPAPESNPKVVSMSCRDSSILQTDKDGEYLVRTSRLTCNTAASGYRADSQAGEESALKTPVPAAPRTAEGAAEIKPLNKQAREFVDKWLLDNSGEIDVEELWERMPGDTARNFISWLFADVSAAYAASETARADRAEQGKKEALLLASDQLRAAANEGLQLCRVGPDAFEWRNIRAEAAEMEARTARNSTRKGNMPSTIFEEMVQWKTKAKSAEHDLATANKHASELNVALAEARKAIKLIIGRDNNMPWSDVLDSEVDAYMKAAAALTPNPSTPKETP